MKFIEIELDGTAVRAQLNEDKAPRTAQALWDALPFEGRAVHAQTSGDMFRMLDETPIPELPLESPEAYQHPGEVVYYPPIREIAFCLGEARFRGHTGYLALTPLAEIEGDWSDWAKKADALQFTGARRITFRKAADQQTPFRHPPAPKGRKIEVELGAVRARATLLEEWAPKTTAAFANLLPLAGKATNTIWSGQITRFWGPVGERGEVGLDIAEPENGKVLHWPGYIYYFPEYRGIRMCYGEGTMSGPWSAATLTPLAKFDPGWEDLRQKALSMLTEGEQSMSFTLVD